MFLNITLLLVKIIANYRETNLWLILVLNLDILYMENNYSSQNCFIKYFTKQYSLCKISGLVKILCCKFVRHQWVILMAHTGLVNQFPFTMWKIISTNFYFVGWLLKSVLIPKIFSYGWITYCSSNIYNILLKVLHWFCLHKIDTTCIHFFYVLDLVCRFIMITCWYN